MHTTEQPQIVEAFLLIEQPRQRLGHWSKALAALDAPSAPPTVAIVAYYDPTCDQALIDLQYDAASANMRLVADLALLAEVGMVQPMELSEGERTRFLAERLTRCTIRVTTQRTAVGALTELVRRIKDARASKVSTSPPPTPPAAPARSIQPRGDTEDPVMLVNAKGTRDDLERLSDGKRPEAKQPDARATASPLGDGPEPPPLPRADTTGVSTVKPQPPPPRADATGVSTVPPSPAPRRETTAAEAPGPRRDQARERLASPDRHRTVPMPAELSQRLIGESSQLMDLRTLPKPPARAGAADPGARTPPPLPTPPIVARASHSDVERRTPAPRVEIPPLSRQHVEAPTRETTLAPRARVEAPTRETTPAPRARVEASTEPYLPTRGAPQLPNVIHARYLRGGRWVPVRVGALSLKGAALLSGALPRVDDRVDVALAFGQHRALVRGIVGKVSSTREATASGVSTFSVAFDLDDNSRRTLTALLVAARDAKVTIKPPPPRATRRFPVEWQVALGTVRGAVKATALDVSVQGMFVQPAVPLEVGSTVTFSVVLDDGTSPIAGRAKVVRQVKEVEAKECGLLPGYGIVIVSMSEADRMRWLGFLARIERRADKRVLIGADPARLAELQAGLASLGYAVTGGTDPGALVQLAKSDGRPADAVLIDAGWLQNEASAYLMESLFSARNVPCVTMQGQVRRARQAIDRLLEVVV